MKTSKKPVTKKQDIQVVPASRWPELVDPNDPYPLDVNGQSAELSVGARNLDWFCNCKPSYSHRHVLKLKPGTWIRFKWKNTRKFSIGLLIKPPFYTEEGLSLLCYYPEDGTSNSLATYENVEAVVGVIDAEFSRVVAEERKKDDDNEW